MTRPYLHGNSKPCPKCDSTGREFAGLSNHSFPCKTCKGTGRKRLKDTEIVRRTCIEARRSYWPQFTERTAANG